MGQQLEDLLSIAERTYIRFEAENLIGACLEQENLAPFNDLLHDLVFAGSSSLYILREVLQVIRRIKTALSQEGLGVRQDLMHALEEFGIQIPNVLDSKNPEAYWHICRQNLRREVMDVAGQLRLEDVALIEEICLEAGNRVTSVAKRLVLVRQLEESVCDWIDGLAYESMRMAETKSSPGVQMILH